MEDSADHSPHLYGHDVVVLSRPLYHHGRYARDDVAILDFI